MTGMGEVWDRTVEVLRGRASILGSIALVSVFLPSVLRDAMVFLSPGATGLIAVVGLIALVATMWGQLAMLAVATDPATDRAEAWRLAATRLLPALGIVVALGFAFSLLILPAVFVLAGSGIDFSKGTIDPAAIPSATRTFLTLYSIVFMAVALWLGARLILINPVILRERRGLGAIMRSVRLTQGATWRIVAVMLVFIVVVLVVASALQVVIGLILRLILGAGAVAVVTFVAGVVASAVTTVMGVVAAAFTAQLYVAARDSAKD